MWKVVSNKLTDTMTFCKLWNADQKFSEIIKNYYSIIDTPIHIYVTYTVRKTV